MRDLPTLPMSSSFSPLAIGVLSAVTGIVIVWVIRRFVAFKGKAIPGPWGLPIVGYLPFLGMKSNVVFTELSKKYGDVFQVRLGSRKVVVVNGQRAIKEGLLKDRTDFAGRPDFFTNTTMPSFGFSTYSEMFRIHKKVCVKAFGTFSRERRSELLQVGHKAAAMIFMEVSKSNGMPFDPQSVLYKAACSIICYICYGRIYDGGSPVIETMLSNIREFANGFVFGIINDYLPWTRIFIKGKLERFKKSLECIHNYSNQLASEHIDTYDGEHMRDITDMFHKANDEIADKERLDIEGKTLKITVSSIFGAGFGTVASALRYMFIIMALHDDIQKKVQAEIDRVIGRGRLPEFEDIDNMPYTNAVIIENYRFHSMAALGVTRAAICDTQLDGYHIAKDTPVIFNYYSAHRDSSVFKDPYIYNPDRFLTSDGQLDTKAIDNVIPYGLGLRRCAGEVIARLEISLFFMTIMQRCMIEESPNSPLDHENYIITMGITHKDIKVIVKPRYTDAFDV